MLLCFMRKEVSGAEYDIEINVKKLINGDKFISDKIDIFHGYEEYIINSYRILINFSDELKKF